MAPGRATHVPVLAGRHVRLEPLSLAHVPGLCEVGLDPELWRITVSYVATAADMRRYVEAALADRDAGTALPYAQVEVATGRVVGSTRLANWAPAHRRIEIGWTWIAPPWQRTAINTEAKLLLMTHAFETLGCAVVGLRTDNFNFRSQRAIEALGAKRDGVLRHHAARRDGTVRDSVMYSILLAEWRDVKRHLELRLARGGRGAP